VNWALFYFVGGEGKERGGTTACFRLSRVQKGQKTEVPKRRERWGSNQSGGVGNACGYLEIKTLGDRRSPEVWGSAVTAILPNVDGERSYHKRGGPRLLLRKGK